MRKTIALLALGLVVLALQAGQAQKPLRKEWEVNLTTSRFIEAGWPPAMNYGDVDGDGKVEIIVPWQHEENRIVCLEVDSTGAKVQWVFPKLGEDQLKGDPCGVALGDINADGKVEILLSLGGAQFFCLDGTGKVIWQFTPAGSTDVAPSLFDVDGDGKLEVFFAASKAGVYCLNFDGSLRWLHPLANDMSCGVTPWDVDRDGDVELITATEDGKYLFCLSSGGIEKWRYSVVQEIHEQMPVVADVDKDGEYEILFIATGTDASTVPELNVVSFFGTPVWKFPLMVTSDPTNYFALSVGDVDVDGYLEVFTADLDLETGRANLYCIDGTGKVKWKSPAQVPTYAYQVLLTDFDGDGKVDVVGGMSFFHALVFNNKGQLTWAWDQSVIDKKNLYPAPGGLWHPDIRTIVGDFDNDGKVEWVFTTGDNSPYKGMVYCFTADGAVAPGTEIWTRPFRTAANVAVLPMSEVWVSALALAVAALLRRR